MREKIRPWRQGLRFTGGNVRANVVQADRFIETDYNTIVGMSSAFAASVAVAAMRIQSEAGMYGNVAEIGTFEGRFFIPLTMSLQEGERAVAIDTFDWPDDGIKNRFLSHLERFGISGRVNIITQDSRTLTPEDIAPSTHGHKVRFFHIDGDHQSESLASDMQLAMDCSEPWCILCLDDMLSPAYPELVSTVMKILEAKPEWVVYCIVDREDIVASTKFMIARREVADLYSQRLASMFPDNLWPMGGQFAMYKALVLAPRPKFLRFERSDSAGI